MICILFTYYLHNYTLLTATTNESASPTINRSTGPSPIASKSAFMGNIEYDTFISSPEYKAYQMHYRIDNCIVKFFSRNDKTKAG